MSVRRVWIEGFRCYRHAELRFDAPLVVVTGSNDGGKSACLAALRLVCDPKQRPEVADFRLLEPGGHTRGTYVEIGLELEDGSGVKNVRRRYTLAEGAITAGPYERLEPIPRDVALREVGGRWAVMTADEQRRFLIEHGSTRTANKGERDAGLRELLARAECDTGWREVAGAPDLPEVRHYAAEQGADPISEVEKVLKAAVKDTVDRVKARRGYRAIVREVTDEAQRHIQDLAGIFARYDYQAGGARLEPELDVDLVRGLSVRDLYVQQKGARTPLSKLGAAKRRKLQLALMEWQLEVLRARREKTPLLLLYDEPDVHFDYDGQRKLFAVLKKLAGQGNVQVAVATHSLSLIDRVPLESVVHLRHGTDENGIAFTSIHQLSEWGDVAAIARDLGIKNHVFLNACLLLVEGQAEDRLLPALFALHAGYTLESAGVELVRDGTRGKDYTWTLTKHALRNGRRAFLALDGDARTKHANDGPTAHNIAAFNQEVGRKAICETSNLAFLGTAEMEDVFPDHVLVKALRHYFEEAGVSRPPSRAALTPVVAQARAHPNGLSKGLQKYASQAGLPNLSKPLFAGSLVEIVRSYRRPRIPQPLRDAFGLLERYIDA